MTQIRQTFAIALFLALLALAGISAPAAAAATVHCESTGGGTFLCETNTSGRNYSWKASNGAQVTKNLGRTALGTCTIGTKPTVNVIISYYSSNASSTTQPPITATTSFPCTASAV